MRTSLSFRCLACWLCALLLAGCGALDGSRSEAQAKSARASQALKALETPSLAPKDLFDRLPKRHIGTLAVTGDSLSIGLAQELEKALGSRPGLGFVKLGKVSSGLARPDFFDWERHMDALARRHAPDAVLIMLGTNDNKHLLAPDGSQITYGTPQWDKAYRERAANLVRIVRAHNPTATVFWLGAPVMSGQALSRDLRHINAQLRKAMQGFRDCHFVDTWPLFATPSGEFAFSKPGVEDGQILRARDGVHMTSAGSQALAGLALQALQARIDLDAPRQAHNPAPLAPSQAAQGAANAPLKGMASK